MGSTDGVAGDGEPFQHGMGIAFEHRTVHEGPGVAFVGITDHVLDISFGLSCEAPLHTCGKPRAPATPETRCLDLLDDRIGTHPDGPFEPQVSAPGDVVIHIGRVDRPAVSKDDPHLVPDHGKIGKERSAVLRHASHDREDAIPERFPFDHVGLEYLLRRLRGHLPVKDAAPVTSPHLHQHFGITEAEAAHFQEAHLFRQGCIPGGFPKSIENFQGAGGPTAGGRTHQDPDAAPAGELLPFPFRFVSDLVQIHPSPSINFSAFLEVIRP